MKQILIIEDDVHVREPLIKYFGGENYRVFGSPNLAEARRCLKENNIHLMILDWNLPDGQGVDFVKECRGMGLQTPIILLTARTDLIDKVVCLEVGANDYMTKPFEPRELLARVRVHLRENLRVSNSSQPPSLVAENGIKLNITERRVDWKGAEVELTRKEFDLLKIFLENPNKVFSRDELLNMVWGYDEYPSTRTVDNHLLRLRQLFSEDFFETVRGVGYRFKRVSENS